MSVSRKRIVLTTFGSLGDLHPYVGVAVELKRRGHVPVIATSEFYRSKIEALGVEFAPLRPDYPSREELAKIIPRMMDHRHGTERVFRELVIPYLEQTYRDTLAAAAGADVLVSHPLSLMTSVVSEKTGLPWVSTVLAPISMLSAYDPPVVSLFPYLRAMRILGPIFGYLLRYAADTMTRPWVTSWYELRDKIGLPTTKRNPIFEGQHSPTLVLAMFSRYLASAQPDWPPNAVITGFPFFDEDGHSHLDPELDKFLDAGPAPIVFTLGSSAVMSPGAFFKESVLAAQKLRCRAVLLAGRDTGNWPTSLPEGVVVFPYAPFSQLFARAAAIVHQGGVGTTGQAMRSGRPQLVMPYAHDQFDNAARVCRHGIARTIKRGRYNASTAARELGHLLIDKRYSVRAAEVGALVSSENGPASAAVELEKLLAR